MHVEAHVKAHKNRYNHVKKSINSKTESTICFFASKNVALSYQILIRHAINSMPRKEGLTFLLHFPYVVELTFYR